MPIHFAPGSRLYKNNPMINPVDLQQNVSENQTIPFGLVAKGVISVHNYYQNLLIKQKLCTNSELNSNDFLLNKIKR